MEIKNLVNQSLNVGELITLLETSDSELAVRLKMDSQEDIYGKTKEIIGKLVRRRTAQLLLQRMGPAQYLDSETILKAVDTRGMTNRIRHLSEQMKVAQQAVDGEMDSFLKQVRQWRLRRVIVVGLGGSGIGPLVTVELLNNMGYHIPAEIHRDYPGGHLRADESTLVILSSFSGDTEETLFAYEYAIKSKSPVICITKGGLLKEEAKSLGHAFIEIPIKKGFKEDETIQEPRESIGFSIMIFLSIFSKLGLAAKRDAVFNIEELDWDNVFEKINKLDEKWGPKVPFGNNLAKQAALYFLYGLTEGRATDNFDYSFIRTPIIMVDRSNASLGVRIENQFGECVESFIKVLTFWEDAHNEIEELTTLALESKLLEQRSLYTYIAIRSAEEESRAAQRFDKTLDELFLKNRIDFLSLKTVGETVAERKLYLLKFLDYIRAYVSLLRGTNPLPVPFMKRMKDLMWGYPTTEDKRLLDLLTNADKTWTVKELEEEKNNIGSGYPLIKTNLERLKNAKLIDMDSNGRITVAQKGRGPGR